MESDLPTMFCLTCKYALIGLPEPRCPECGREFQPDDPTSYSDGQDSRWLRKALRYGLRAATTPFLVIPFMWVSPALPLGAAIGAVWSVLVIATNCRWRRWKSAAIVVLLSPFFILFSAGAVDYSRGAGRLLTEGLPGPRFYDVDPVYRCQRSNTGCVVTGNEWMTSGSYNLALTTLIRTFGPMKGSYTGPYPTKESCLTALQDAESVDVEELLRDRVPLSGGTVNLVAGVGRGMLMYENWSGFTDPETEPMESIRAIGPITAILDRTCLILRVPEPEYGFSGSAPQAMIALIDSASGKPFAYYAEGDRYRFYPRSHWQER